jgi:hypothetical protein
MVVTAYDQYLNKAAGFADTVYFISSDSSATLPGAHTYTTGDAGGHTFSVTFATAGTQSVTAIDANTGMSGSASSVVNGTAATASKYTPITPVRVLDTRYGMGHYGRLTANVPLTFQVTGVAGIPAENANSDITAVTGNLTVAVPSSGWAVYVGPAPLANPTASTINFAAGQTASNGVTVALSSTGTLSATYISFAGNSTDLVFDVTGYFTNDATGTQLLYHPIAPFRAVDTRVTPAFPLGGIASLVANQPVCWNVATGTITGALAVTGNVTVTNASSGWAVALGPTLASVTSPSTSTLNFTGGTTQANGVTIVLGAGNLCAAFISSTGNTADLVFDVTGYYTAAAGLAYYPIAPVRIVDSRANVGLSSKLPANSPRGFQVANVGTIDVGALAITGNLTMVNETSGWAAYVGPAPVPAPSSSTINFSAGQIISNDVTVQLGAGFLYATYISTAGNTTDMVLDVSGYFK